jgi:DNA-binding MarR family transcriptional regulator
MIEEEAASVETPVPRGPLDLGLTSGYLGPKLRVLWNVLNARMVASLAPFGLKIGAFSTMALISANPGCSQNQLARDLGLDKSAVVALIDELESHGLATRERPAEDRRRHALKLTARGEAMLRTMAPAVARPGRPIREALSAREMEQLLALLDRAYRAMIEAETEGEG